MKKYKKVTEIDVLKKYKAIQGENYSIGIWEYYLSANFLAKEMQTSEYQIRKAFKKLKEQGYISLEKVPTYFEEYDNGLYTESYPVLFTKAYVLTEKGIDYCKKHYEELKKELGWNG